ncbi:MAG: HAD-IA family hydrolase [Elusimicrobia bacterium]|nr:HAD-IA family hydrolase [Elusimicrobiota bacterium]
MKAVVFDMDGVMVDSEREWRRQEGPFLKRLIPAWRSEDLAKITGFGVEDLHRWLVKEYGLMESPGRFAELCRAVAEDIYRNRTRLETGLPGFFIRLEEAGIPMGLASSSPRAWIDLVLERFKLARYFRAVTSADDVEGEGKPSPRIHLKAAGLLGVDPRDCVAIEDSFVGVRAAKKAGMFCVGFRNGYNQDQDLSAADAEISSFSGLKPGELARKLRLARDEGPPS